MISLVNFQMEFDEIPLGPSMDNSRYSPNYYNGNVLSFAADNGFVSFVWNATQGCAFTHNFSFSFSSESPMPTYDNSMPNYRYNSNYDFSNQRRPMDTTNYGYGSTRPSHSYGSNPNYGYPSGQRYEPRPQSNTHPHYYSERNVMSFK